MAKINLLPWREEYRQEKRKEFLAQLGLVVVVAIIAAITWIKLVDSAISFQNERNNLLKSEIDVLERKVQEINELKKKRQELIARMRVIQDLQGTRPTIVRYFDEVVRAVPEGLFFTSIKRSGNRITVVGVTESSNRVSSFMRNLDASEWFSEPNLRSIKSNSKLEGDTQEFLLQFKAVLPADQQGEER